MSIIRWEPFREMERFFEDDLSLIPSKLSRVGWDLAVDLYEEKDNFIAEMNLPGVDPDKIEITIEGDHLRITGERLEEMETREKNYYSKEIRRGSFERTVRLPGHVKAEGTEAEYEAGVLKVTLPKLERAEVKAVKVKAKAEVK